MVLSLLVPSHGQVMSAQTNAQQQGNLQKSIALIRPNIVQVIRKLPPNTPGEQIIPLGSGFFVSPGYVVTNWHVIDGLKPEELMVALPLPDTERMRGNFDDARAVIVDQDKVHDLALLQVVRTRPSSIINGKPPETRINPLKFKTDRPLDGTQVAVSGYPLHNFVVQTNQGAISSAWDVNTKEFADRYKADMTINPGNSGGPVFQVETGKIIGCAAYQPASVTSQGERVILPGNKSLSYNFGLAMIIPARYVVDLLKENKVTVISDDRLIYPPEFSPLVTGRPPVEQRPLIPRTKFVKVQNPIPNKYIVVLNDDVVSSDAPLDVRRERITAIANSLAKAHRGTVESVYETALKGFSIELPNESAAIALSKEPQVKWVEEVARLWLGISNQAPQPRR